MARDCYENQSNGINTKSSQQSELLTYNHQPMFLSPIITELITINDTDFVPDNCSNKATYKRKQIILEIVNNSHVPWGTSAKKILTTAVLYLTSNNYGNHINQYEVMIPLHEYGKANGYELTPRIMDTEEEQAKEAARVRERIKDFKDHIRRDLDILKNIQCTITAGGRQKSDVVIRSIISDYDIVRENKTTYIKISFDKYMADYISKKLMMQFPTSLLRIDNRHDNAYAVGYKIAMQNSLDNNAIKGTANTLKVSTLLANAPAIQTYEQLRQKNRRDWKKQIKSRLEQALNANVKVGFIIHWSYRDPKTGTNYTPQEASNLRWAEYNNLDVDFELLPNPKQDERRQKKYAKMGGVECTQWGVFGVHTGGC